MQIKAILRFHLTPVRMVLFKKSIDVGKRNLRLMLVCDWFEDINNMTKSAIMYHFCIKEKNQSTSYWGHFYHE